MINNCKQNQIHCSLSDSVSNLIIKFAYYLVGAGPGYALKSPYPDVMTQFYLRAKIGRRRTQIGGNFTGLELKMLLKETSLADLAEIIPNGAVVTQYLRSLRELHKMVFKKQQAHQEPPVLHNSCAERFKEVR